MDQSISNSPLHKTMYSAHPSGTDMNRTFVMGSSFAEKSPLNLSKSKAMFSFSKANRFQNNKR